MPFVVWFFLGLLWLLPIETLAQGVKSDAGRDEPYDVNEEDGPKRVSPPLHGFAEHAKKHGVPSGLADIAKRALADSSVEGFASEQPRSEALAKNLAALNGKKEDGTFDLSASISDMESQKVDIIPTFHVNILTSLRLSFLNCSFKIKHHYFLNDHKELKYF